MEFKKKTKLKTRNKQKPKRHSIGDMVSPPQKCINALLCLPENPLEFNIMYITCFKDLLVLTDFLVKTVTKQELKLIVKLKIYRFTSIILLSSLTFS